LGGERRGGPSDSEARVEPKGSAPSEDELFAEASVVYPQYQPSDILRYLDEAKEHIDVIDFRRPRYEWMDIQCTAYIRVLVEVLSTKNAFDVDTIKPCFVL
jgi:hypothetical protein